jgi:predicted dehydrogenase
MSKVRIGFIGCGGRAGSHMRALGQREDTEIVGACDVVEAAARRAGERLGVPHYTDHRTLLGRDDLDAVVISVPVFAHGQVELDVIARGLPFLLEKPVARDLETARRVAGALRQAGLWAAIGYQLRYTPAVRQAKAFMVGRRVAVVEGHYWCTTARGGAWQNDWEKSGGQLVEQATHTIDLMRHLVGEVEEVYSQQASRILSAITSPDAYTVSLRFTDGALGSLTSSWTHDTGDWSHANIVNVSLDGCLLRLDGAGARVLPAGKAELPEVAGAEDMYKAFVRSVRAGGPEGILSGYDDALATLAVSLAANESAATHRPVRVAEAVGR